MDTTAYAHIIVIATLLGAVALFSPANDHAQSTFASAADDSSNVSVSVDETTVVSISPNLFNFSSVGIGETNFSTRSEFYLRIKNDGSTNITDVYAHPDTLLSEQDNPLGSGNPEQYAAGRFLWIKNETSSMYHAGTLSWNISADAGGVPNGITNEPTNTVARGFYRNATADYLWVLASNHTGTGHNATCDASQQNSPALLMKNVSDTGDNRDMNVNTVTYKPADADRNSQWSTEDATGNDINGSLDGHYLSIHESCEKFYAYRFDADSQFPLSGQGDQYLIGPSSSSALTPGEQHDARLGVAVPQGIPAGTTNRTLLTVTATAQ